MENNEPIEQLNSDVLNGGMANSVIVGKKEDLPKYTLPRGERLYITREQLTELNDDYNELLNDLKESRETLPADLRSIMESVIGKAYLEDIEELRLDNRLSMDRERERKLALIGMLTPRTWRSWFFRKKRNQSQVLLDELVNRQAVLYWRDRADELPSVGDNGEEVDQKEVLPFEVTIDSLLCSLPHLSKKRREIVNGLTQQLYEAYNSKKEEVKRLAEELEENKKQLEQALGRAITAEERLDEFLKESTPEPAEEAQDADNEEESAEPKGEAEEISEEGEPTEEVTEGEEQESEPADEEEEEGLSYDGLDEEDGQE